MPELADHHNNKQSSKVEDSEEELIPAEDEQIPKFQTGVFNFNNDANSIMVNTDNYI